MPFHQSDDIFLTETKFVLQIGRKSCEENHESKSHWLIPKSWLSLVYFSAFFIGLFNVLLSP